MGEKAEKQFVLLQDIVIPKGTIFKQAPNRTVHIGDDLYETIIGLTDDTSGVVNYCVDNEEQLSDWFLELK